jgi:hypothetical protein
MQSGDQQHRESENAKKQKKAAKAASKLQAE